MIDPLVKFVYDNIDVDFTLEEWATKIADWEFNPIYQEGNLVAAVMVRRNEVHLAADKRYRGKWLTRKVIRAIFGTIIKEYGHAITSVGWGDEDAAKFIERLGFKPEVTVYKLEKLNHIKEALCHQSQQQR